MNRTLTIQIYVNNSEKEELQKSADFAGFNLATFCRVASLQSSRKNKKDGGNE